MKISDIRSKDLSTMISVEGGVTSIKGIHPKWKTIAYKCDICGLVMEIPVESTKINKPPSCEREICKNKSNFTMIEKRSSKTDYQEVQIEELYGYDPRLLLVYLEGNLVDTVNLKDEIVVDGILKAQFKLGASIGDFVLEATSIKKIEELSLVNNKKTKTSQSKSAVIIEIIQKLSYVSGLNKVLIEDVYAEALLLGISKEDVDIYINKMRLQGDLFCPDKDHVVETMAFF